MKKIRNRFFPVFTLSLIFMFSKNLSANSLREDSVNCKIDKFIALGEIYSYWKWFCPFTNYKDTSIDYYLLRETADILTSNNTIKAYVNDLRRDTRRKIKNIHSKSKIKNNSDTFLWQHVGIPPISIENNYFRGTMVKTQATIESGNLQNSISAFVDIPIDNNVINHNEFKDIKLIFFVKSLSPTSLSTELTTFERKIIVEKEKFENEINGKDFWTKIEYKITDYISFEKIRISFENKSNIEVFIDDIYLVFVKRNGNEKYYWRYDFDKDITNSIPSIFNFGAEGIKSSSSGIVITNSLFYRSKCSSMLLLALKEDFHKNYDNGCKLYSDIIQLYDTIYLYKNEYIICPHVSFESHKNHLLLDEFYKSKKRKYYFDLGQIESKIAVLIIVYSNLKNFHPNYFKYKAEFDSTFREILINIINKKNNSNELETHLNSLGSILQDGHFYVWLPKSMNLSSFYPNFEIRYLDNEWRILNLTQDSIKRFNGKKVVKIDDKLVADIEIESHLYTNTSNPETALYLKGKNLLIGRKNSELKIGIIENNSDTINYFFKRNLESYNSDVLNRKEVKFKWYFDSILYVNFGKINIYEFDSLLGLNKKISYIIFDNRNYPNIGNYRILGNFISENDTIKGVFKIPCRSYTSSYFPTYIEQNLIIPPRLPYLNCKLILLNSVTTKSYGEMLAYFFKYFKLGKIVGEPTYGAIGTTNHFRVPGNIEIHFTQTLFVNKSNSKYARVDPDYPFPKSFYAEMNLDKLIDYLIEIR